jgi:hypothetical protein
MATRLALPREQVFSDTGTPLPGAKLYFYAAGTSTAKTTYSDAALTTANANPVIADSAGRFGDVFLDTGDYRVILKTAADVTVWTADPVAGASSGGSLLSGVQNLLINGDFRVNQRGSTSVADDTYCLDRWYALTQSGNATVAQQARQENGQYANIRLTQPDVGAKRLGLAQIVEAADATPTRGGAVALGGRIRASVSQAYRYAILEWTGTADAVTSDVILDWTSASYTPGGFFLGSNVVVVATGSVTPAAAVWTDLPAITGVVSGSANNLLVMVWSEGTLAQNATLDLGLLRLVVGSTASSFPARTLAGETALCQRFYATQTAAAQGATVGFYITPIYLPVEMRATPTVTNVAAGSLSNATVIQVTMDSRKSAFMQIQATVANGAVTGRIDAYNAEL